MGADTASSATARWLQWQVQMPAEMTGSLLSVFFCFFVEPCARQAKGATQKQVEDEHGRTRVGVHLSLMQKAEAISQLESQLVGRRHFPAASILMARSTTCEQGRPRQAEYRCEDTRQAGKCS